MSTQDPNRQGRGGEARSGGSGMPKPSSPVVAIVIAAVAGLLALLILRDVTEDDSGGGGGGSTSKTTTQTTSASSTTGFTTTTAATIRTGATVVVANCSGVGGAAGNLTTALDNRGYDTGKATNCTSETAKKDVTVIMVKSGDAAATAVGTTLQSDMGVTAPLQPLPADPPIDDPMGSATVLVMLGKDKANQPLKTIGTTETSVATNTTEPKETTTTKG